MRAKKCSEKYFREIWGGDCTRFIWFCGRMLQGHTLFCFQKMCNYEPKMTRGRNCHLPHEFYPQPDGAVAEGCSPKVLILVWYSMGRFIFRIPKNLKTNKKKYKAHGRYTGKQRPRQSLKRGGGGGVTQHIFMQFFPLKFVPHQICHPPPTHTHTSIARSCTPRLPRPCPGPTPQAASQQLIPPTSGVPSPGPLHHHSAVAAVGCRQRSGPRHRSGMPAGIHAPEGTGVQQSNSTRCCSAQSEACSGRAGAHGLRGGGCLGAEDVEVRMDVWGCACVCGRMPGRRAVRARARACVTVRLVVQLCMCVLGGGGAG